MFLSNVRTALIVAINIPLALLFAFAMLYLRGKSANLLSIGAVDFGIIVDSSVIMVENIYRHLTAGERGRPAAEAADPPRDGRDRAAPCCFRRPSWSAPFCRCSPCAARKGSFSGPWPIPMPSPWRGGLLLAVLLSPVLCLLLLRKLKPTQDNFLVRWLKIELPAASRAGASTIRWTSMAVLAGLLAVTVVPDAAPWAANSCPNWKRATSGSAARSPSTSPCRSRPSWPTQARAIMRSIPRWRRSSRRSAGPTTAPIPSGFNNVEFFVPLQAAEGLAGGQVAERAGGRSFGATRPRTKARTDRRHERRAVRKLARASTGTSRRTSATTSWNRSPASRATTRVKIFGPDLDELERLAEKMKKILDSIPGVEDVGIFRIKGQPNLEFRVDPREVQALGRQRGRREERRPDGRGRQGLHADDRRRKDLRHHAPLARALRSSEAGDPRTSRWTSPTTRSPPGYVASIAADAADRRQQRRFARGHAASPCRPRPAASSAARSTTCSQRRGGALGDLVTPLDDAGQAATQRASFIRSGASTIYREQGNRLIAVKFSVRGRDLAGAVAEAQAEDQALFPPVALPRRSGAASSRRWKKPRAG